MPIRHRSGRVLVGTLALIALAILGLALAGALYVPNTEIPDGFAGRHVSVDGIPLRVLQVGSGRDVLLIHGSPGSIEDWAPEIEALAGSFRLTAYDRPGQGFSGDTGQYSNEYNAEIASALIDALQLENAIVAGHSFGGSTALALARRAPASVSAYVIVDSAVYEPSREPGALYRLLAVPWLGTGFARLAAPIAQQQIADGLEEVFEPRKPPAGFVELRTRIWSTPKVMHALSAEIVGHREGLARLSPHYPEIQQPVYIVAQADDAFRRGAAEHLHRDIRDSQLELVPETGHYVQIEKPASVVDAIRRAASTAQ